MVDIKANFRFCMTSVTNGDYARPRKISEFLNVLLDGFR